MIVLFLFACAAHSISSSISTPESPVQESVVEASAVLFNVEWKSMLDQDHPLVGTAWSPSLQRYLSMEELQKEIHSQRYLLLGEKHDNPDHHILQADLLTLAMEDNSSWSIAFEMLSAQELIPNPLDDSTKLAEAVRWSESGWPEFVNYQPIFDVAIANGHILAANPPRENLLSIMSEGLDSLDPQAVMDLQLTETLPEELQRVLEEEIYTAHCGHGSPEMVSMMVTAQRLKDAWMARSLQDSKTDRAALIAGTGHTRTDRGVPYYLSEDSLSVHFVEVQTGQINPSEYVISPADIVIFTPRLEDVDPCEKFRKSLEQMNHSKE